MPYIRRAAWVRLWLAAWVVAGSVMAAGWRERALEIAASEEPARTHGLPTWEGSLIPKGPSQLALSNMVGWAEETACLDSPGDRAGTLGRPVQRVRASASVRSLSSGSQQNEHAAPQLHWLCVYRL